MRAFDATDVLDVSEELRSISAYCDNVALDNTYDQHRSPDENFVKRAITAVEQAEHMCKECGFRKAKRTAMRAAGRLGLYVVRDEFAGIGAECNRVADAIWDDMAEHSFLSVHPDRSWCIDNAALLGKDVLEAFPEAKTDIVETGNCLAAECATAAVFHAMRVVEFGLRFLCVSQGLKKAKVHRKKAKYVPIPYTDWETMLNQLQPIIDKKIEKLKRGAAKQKEQEFYYPVLQDIKAIRDAWRNHTMHTRSHYDIGNATAIVGHVQRIMQTIAERKLGREKDKPGISEVRRSDGKASASSA